MKTRNSLVSNSSSASFVITWKSLNLEDEIPAREAIQHVFNESNPDLNVTLTESIVQQTSKLKSGAFRSEFSTSMYNIISDFGSDAAFLMMALYLSNDFEIIDARIEDYQG